MKKIMSILTLICVFACSSYVHANEIGIKKKSNETHLSVVDNHAIECNTSCAAIMFDINSSTSLCFYTVELSKANLEVAREVDISRCYISYFTYKTLKNTKGLSNNYLIPNRIYIDVIKRSYAITKPTTLPKHYLLPSKNETWQFGSNKQNC